nr:unnamed protein product [Digitaria exilis]
MATSYSRRLLAAADFVLSADAQDQWTRLPALDVTADLKPHQLDGVAWLIRRYRLGVNVVLGTSSPFMGLGKTLQAISLLSHLKIQRIASGPFLVLCPLSVTDGWISEFSKFCPSLRVLQYVGDKVHRRDLRTTLYEHVQRTKSSHSNVIQLRKACSHPYLFSGIEPEPYVEGEHLVQASGKLIVLDLVLKKLHELGHRVLLFAQMTQTLDILQDFLELRNYTYERLDGSVRAEERFAAIRNFSSLSTKGLMRDDNQSGAFVFMISTRAGGVGLNLIGADTVIFYEQDWNPQADKQALQRAHRIGQLNHVLSMSLVSEHTIEEVIMRRAERKLKLSYDIIGEDNKTDVKGGDLGNEASGMRSIIFGLHLFDPADTTTETINDYTSETINVEKLAKLKIMSEEIVMMRSHEPSEKHERLFEINLNSADGSGTMIRRASDSISVDPALNEEAYLSWVKKFKEASHSIEDATAGLGTQRSAPEEKFLKREVNRKKIEEKRLAKWETLGYKTLAVREPDIARNQNISDSGSVHLVYGDCTNPSKVCPAKPAIIFSCIDNSGTWGHGGMFDALSGLSTCIPDAYHRASEFDDLHMGDLHLIQLDG